ncbi:hypothetical protein E4U09_004113 [Claviceps aff. purpurea]|uniref:Pisatin demethylase cytochrome P450 n=1 Tax=Claviceps aff. purpurea TaxID=1967640 RepID=A0A9P7QDJ8_9HYPO|nr:hypothetical protein E4U09_004113 [Claviceps aff. purpurea]
MLSSWTVADAAHLMSKVLSKMLFTTVCLSCVSLLMLVAVVALYRITFHPLARVPGPKLAAISSFWYARNIVEGNMVKLGLELHRKYGDIVRVGPNELWFNTTEAFDQIYCTGKGELEKSDFYLATALNRPHVDWRLEAHFPDTLDLLSERSMKRYRLQRRLIGRAYSAANMLKHESAIDSTLAVAIKRLVELDGQEVDLKEWMHILTVECLGAAVLSWSPGMFRDGTDWGTLTHSYQGWRRKSLFGVFPTMKKLEQWSPDLGRVFASWWGVVYKTPKDFRPFFPNVNRLVIRRIKAIARPKSRKPQRDGRADLLGDLIQLHKDKPEFNENYLRKMAVTNFGAGHETMASTLTSAVAMIASHDTVQRRLTQEVRTTTEALVYANSHRLAYTKAAIREAMRLHPVVAMSLPRKTPPTGLHVHGLSVPPHTTVGCSPIALHRKEEIFGAEPDSYEPCRWLGAEMEGRSVREMEKYSLNWGGGSRSCPGRNLAELIVFKTIAALFANFDVEVSVPEDAHKEAYFLFMLSGVRVRFLPRAFEDDEES